MTYLAVGFETKLEKLVNWMKVWHHQMNAHHSLVYLITVLFFWLLMPLFLRSWLLMSLFLHMVLLINSLHFFSHKLCYLQIPSHLIPSYPCLDIWTSLLFSLLILFASTWRFLLILVMDLKMRDTVLWHWSYWSFHCIVKHNEIMLHNCWENDLLIGVLC